MMRPGSCLAILADLVCIAAGVGAIAVIFMGLLGTL